MALATQRVVKVQAEIQKVTYQPGNEALKVELSVINTPDNVQSLTKIAETVIIQGTPLPEQTIISDEQ